MSTRTEQQFTLTRQNTTTQITKPKNVSQNSQSNSSKPPRRFPSSVDPDTISDSDGRPNTQPNVTSEFKLLKKIAELTQVVHMLFQSSHTNETELELVKTRATNEVDRLISIHDKMIHELTIESTEKQKQIEDMEEQLKKNETETQVNLKLVQYDLETTKEQRIELQQRFDEMKDSLEKSREVNMGLAKELESARELCTANDYVISDLKSDNQRLSRKLLSFESQKSELEEKLKTFENYSATENSELRNKVESYERKIEEQNKTIGFLELKLSQSESGKENENQDVNGEFGLKRSKTITDFDENLEIARLKRELQQTKLELQNRESNFNRIFSDSQPVYVRGGSSSDNSTTAVRSQQQQQQQSQPQFGKNGWLPNISNSRLKSDRPSAVNEINNSLRRGFEIKSSTRGNSSSTRFVTTIDKPNSFLKSADIKAAMNRKMSSWI